MAYDGEFFNSSNFFFCLGDLRRMAFDGKILMIPALQEEDRGSLYIKKKGF